MQEEIIIGIVIGLVLLFAKDIKNLVFKQWNRILNWMKKSYIERFPLRQTITFFIQHRQELNSGIYYDEIKKSFLKNLKKYGLTKSITHKDFSDIKLFTDVTKAQEFRNDKNLDLILWGEFSNDHLKHGGEHESEIVINFTYGFKHGDENKRQIEDAIAGRIKQILDVKNHWKIRDGNSLVDLRKVADAIFTVSLFTLGLTLTNQGRVEEAEFIFGRLYTYLNDRNDDIAEKLKEYLLICNKSLLEKVRSKKKINWEMVRGLSDKIINLSSTDKYGLVMKAMSSYKTGDLENSEVAIARLIELHPRSGAARVNIAFMHIVKGNYDGALRIYKSVFNDSDIDFETLEIVDFLNIEFQRSKEPAFRYASGVITLNLNGDKNLARQDLLEFTHLSSEKTHGVMYRDAKRILNKLDRAE